MCCVGSGIHLEARRRVFLVERGGIGVRVRRVPRQRRQIQSIGLLSHLFLPSLFWSFLEHGVYKKYCSVTDLVRPMLMKRTKRWHWFYAYVQCSYFKCLCATRPVNCQVLA